MLGLRRLTTALHMEPSPPDTLPKPLCWLALGGILLLAAILRFYNLSQQGFVVFDEGGYVMGAMTTASKAYDVIYTFYRPGFIMLVILSAHLVGWSPLAGQAVSAVLGVLTVGVIYGLTRLLFSQLAALTAALLVATSTYHVFYSRVGLSNATALFFFTAGLYCWLRFHMNRQGLRLYPFAAGLMVGYAFTCHYQSALYLGLGGLIELWLASRARAFHGTILLLLGVLIPVYGFYGEIGVGYVGWEMARLSHVAQLSPPDPFYYLRLLWSSETLPLIVFSLLGLLRAVQTLRQGRVDSEGGFYLFFVACLVSLSVGAAQGQAAPRLLSSLFPFLAVLMGGGATLLFHSTLVRRGRVLLWGSLLALIFLSGMSSNRAVLSWHSEFAEAAEWLHTRYPFSLYACEGWWPVCKFYRLGPEVSDAHSLEQLPFRPQFVFSHGAVSAGTLVASFENPVERHPLVAEENNPGSVRSQRFLKIPGVIRIYDLRATEARAP